MRRDAIFRSFLDAYLAENRFYTLWAMDGPFAATPESVSGRRNPGEAGAGTGAAGFAYFGLSK